MKQIFKANLSDEDKIKMEESYNAGITFIKKLLKVLEDKKEASTKYSRSKENYSNSSWPYLQADAIGYERALSEIISLLK